MGVSAEKAIDENKQGQGMPDWETLGLGMISILFPGEIKPVEQVNPIGYYRPKKDSCQGDVVREGLGYP